MPGDEWQKFANVRTLYAYMWTHPGARLLFMGNEFGQTTEWNYKSELEWNLLHFEPHKKLQECVKDLNHLLKSEPALYENQFNIYGFEWIDLNHHEECVLVYRRRGKEEQDDLLIILNVAPVPRWDWEIEVTGHEYKKEIFNSDLEKYWGSGNVTNPDIRMQEVNMENENEANKEKKFKLIINLPPLAAVVLK